MSANLLALLFVILISCSEAVAQSLSYQSFNKKSKALFVASWLMYLIVVYLLYRAYHYRGVGYINVLWSGVTTLLMLFIGYTFFGERMRFWEWIGVALVMMGIALMIIM